MDISYAKLRKVLAVFLRNELLRKGLEDLLSGTEQEITEVGFLDLLEESNADISVLYILTGRDVEEIPAEEAAEAFASFFTAIRASWKRFEPLLLASGFRLEASKATV